MKRKKTSRIMKRRKREAVKFEDYIYPNVRRRFPASLGWKIDQEHTLKDGSRADYCLWRVKYGKRERAVVEAKNVSKLTKAHIDQLDDYARRYHASYRLIYIPAKTKVDKSVREHAEKLVINIVRTHFGKKRKKKSIWDLI